jgi:hypothetical protein
MPNDTGIDDTYRCNYACPYRVYAHVCVNIYIYIYIYVSSHGLIDGIRGLITDDNDDV